MTIVFYDSVRTITEQNNVFKQETFAEKKTPRIRETSLLTCFL